MSTLLSMAFLAACAGYTYHWEHPNGLDAEALADARAECDEIAYLEAASYPVPPFFSEHNRLHPLHRIYLYDDHYRFRQQRDLFRVCMKAKGWTLVREKLQPRPEA